MENRSDLVVMGNYCDSDLGKQPKEDKESSKEKVDVIKGFQKKYAFLSNSFVGNEFPFEDNKFNNAEAAFQSAKCLNFKAKKNFTKMKPCAAARVGELVLTRSDWEAVKDEMMEKVIWAKFASDKGLSMRLISTYPDILINENPIDDYWGTVDGKGQNKLGEILMKVRDKLLLQYNINFGRTNAVRTAGIQRNLYYSTDKYSEY